MDLSFLIEGSGPSVVQLPDPVKIEQAKLVMEGLRRQNRLGNLTEQETTRNLASRDAYAKAIPEIIQSGFDPQVVAKVLQQYPDAAPLVQDAWDKHAARIDTSKKTDATVYKDQTANLLKQYSQMAGGLAEAIRKDPGSVPDRMIANFYGKMADQGLDKFMPSLDFKDWNDKAAVAAHLNQLGNAFYETSDRIKNEQSGAKNADDSARGWFNAQSEAAHRAAQTKNDQGHLGIAYEDLALKKKAAETAGTMRPQQIVNTELKLADDYKAQSKAFQETARQIGIVNSALKTATTNPGSALAAGTSFMKILDPNSVVRESELGMALNASGWFDRASNIGNQLAAGKIMTKSQAANLERAANDLFREASLAQQKIDAAYTDRARKYGADPSNVVMDLGQYGVPKDKPKLGMGAAGSAPSSAFKPAPAGSGVDYIYTPGG